MIYKFKSQATADIVMLQATGQQILAILGKSGTQGIITVAEQGTAISKIEAAIAEDEAARKAAEAEAAKEGRKLPAPAITLRTRAWPFIEMLKTAQREKADVTWGA